MIRAFRVAGDRLEELREWGTLALQSDTGWIDLLNPTMEEDRAVEDFLKISIPTKEDMQEIELSNRLYDEDGAEYMTMMAVSQVHIDDPVRSPVTFILHGNVLVTVRYSEFLSFSHYLQDAKKKNGVPIPTAGGLMMGVIESFINRIADSLESMGTEIDGISRDIFRSPKTTVRNKTELLQSAIQKIGGKGDVISMLRESLTSITRLLTHYNEHAAEAPDKLLRIQMNMLQRDVASLNDHAGFMSGKITFLLEATLGMINLDQNQIIKIFSIAAVVFLPPTLVASIYGMNFHHMPELGLRFGYPAALAAMLVSAILPIWYFKRKGWL